MVVLTKLESYSKVMRGTLIQIPQLGQNNHSLSCRALVGVEHPTSTAPVHVMNLFWEPQGYNTPHKESKSTDSLILNSYY